MRKEALVAGAVLGLAGGGAALAAYGSGEADPSHLPAAHTTTADLGRIDPMARQICESTTAWDPSTYGSQIGSNSNIVSVIGTSGANGSAEFASDNPSKTAAVVAEKLAPNNLAIAAIYANLTIESGVSDSDIATSATKTFNSMQSGQRQGVCDVVISRVLDTPMMYQLQSTSGKVDVFLPEITDGSAKGVTVSNYANTAPQEVFGIAPIEGGQNPALAEGNSRLYGVNAAGQLIRAVQQEGGQAQSSSGNGEAAGTQVQNAISGQQPEQSKAAGGSSATENSQPTGGAGSVAEGTSSGQSGTGTSGPGGGGETTTSGAAPVETTAPPVETTAPPVETTTPPPPTTPPTTSPPPTTPPTTTPPKDPEPPCDPSITTC